MDDPSRKPRTAEEILEENALRVRRKFLKKPGEVALTAPAVALLLSMEKARADAGGNTTDAITWDRRLKHHVKRVGALPNGLPLYSFRYKWGGPTFVGVMAQDVLRVMPDAVLTDRESFYRVDYVMLGTRLMTLPERRELHPVAA